MLCRWCQLDARLSSCRSAIGPKPFTMGKRRPTPLFHFSGAPSRMRLSAKVLRQTERKRCRSLFPTIREVFAGMAKQLVDESILTLPLFSPPSFHSPLHTLFFYFYTALQSVLLTPTKPPLLDRTRSARERFALRTYKGGWMQLVSKEDQISVIT